MAEDILRYELFVGTYTLNSESKGIYYYSICPEIGQAELKQIIAIENPSFLCFSNGNLCTVNELGDLNGKVTLFGYDKKLEQYEPFQTIESLGSHPCHLSISEQHHLLFASNYTSGSLTTYKLDRGGKVNHLLGNKKYSGKGPNLKRQNSSHIHSAIINTKQNLLFVQDLGGDSIYRYKLDEEGLTNEQRILTSPGSGPRHLVLSKDDQYVYVLLELSAEIAVHKNDEHFSLIQTISINRADFNGYNCAAELKITNDGRFLYATNRGDANVITLYAIDEENGKLQAKAHYDTKGVGPRNFTFSPCNQFVFVANQHSNEVIVFTRDQTSGELTSTNFRLDVPQPVYVVVK